MTTFFVSSGTSAVTLNGGDVLSVYNSGTASPLVINGGGTASAFAGGKENVFTVNNGGTDLIFSGGSATFGTVNSGGTLTVMSGGTATATVSAGGIFAVSGGTVGQSTTLTLGGVATSATFTWPATGGTSAVQAFGETLSGNLVFAATMKVSSGGFASGTVVSNLGVINVSSGGVASSTSVLNGGSATVFTGGNASGTTLANGGAETVSSGGTETGGVVNSGGRLTLVSGGVLSNETLNSGANLFANNFVVSGAGNSLTVEAITAPTVVNWSGTGALLATNVNGTTVSAGAAMTVSAGGVTNNTTLTSATETVLGGADFNVIVGAGGSQVVTGTGITSMGSVSSGGTQILMSGGTAGSVAGNGMTVNASGSQVVSAGGTAWITNLNSGGTQVVSSGGLAISARVLGGASEVVSASGLTSSSIVSAGGTETLLSGGVASKSQVAGSLLVSLGGIDSTATVNSGGTETVSSGGSATGTIVQSGGVQFVQSGGVASNTSVNSGGMERFTPGASLTNIALSAGAKLSEAGVVISGAGNTLTLKANTTSTNITIPAGASVTSATDAFNDTVMSGGMIVVSSGGTTSGVTVSNGGTVNVVQSSGIVSGTIISSGGTVNVTGIAGGGPPEAVGTILYSGGTLNVAGGLTSAVANTTVSSGATFTVSSGTIANSTFISTGGTEVILSGGTDWSPTVLSGGTASVGGIFGNINGQVASGGSAITLSGGTFEGIVQSGGSATFLSGASVLNDAVQLGGTMVFSGYISKTGNTLTGNKGGILIASGGAVTNGLTLNLVPISANGQLIADGATTLRTSAANTTISSGGQILVSSGAIATGTTVSNGGALKVSSGGIASASILSAGGIETVFSTGLERGGTVFTAGTLNVSSGGTANTVTISAGGADNVSAGGFSQSASVLGTETVSAGGSAGLGTVGSGGYEHVLAGGNLVTSETVGSGGAVELANGGASTAAIVFNAASGTVAYDNTGSATTPISGFQADDQIALSAFTAPINSATLSNGGATLTLSDGPQSMVISNISFAPGVISGGQLNGYGFVFDTVNVGGTVMNAVTIDPVPSVTQVTASPDPADLNAGKLVTITVTMNIPVTVSGTPTLVLNDGGTATFNPGLSTSTQLVFTNVVLPVNPDTSPLAITSLSGGTIVSTAHGVPANMAGVVTSFPGLNIDTDTNEQAALGVTVGLNNIGASTAAAVPFTVAGLEPEDTGTVTFSDGTHSYVVNVNGGQTSYIANLTTLSDSLITPVLQVATDPAGNTFTPVAGNTVDLDQDLGQQAALGLTVSLANIGAATATAVPFTVAGLDPEDTGTVTFSDGTHSYAVNVKGGQAGYNANLTSLNDGLITSVLQVATDPAGNSFAPVAGNTVDLDQDLGQQAALKVNMAGPYVNAKQVTTEQFTVAGLDPEDTATVTFSDGGKSVSQTVSANGTYIVNLSALPDGTVTPTLQVASDPAGNTFLPVTGSPVTLDTTPPTVSTVADNPANGDLGLGATVTVSVAMSEAVLVTGSPTLTLNNLGTATYIGGSGTSTLTFSYKVGTGQNVSDLAVNTLNLPGGATITDLAGNTGILTGAKVNPVGRLIIDTTSARTGVGGQSLVGSPSNTNLVGTNSNSVFDISAGGATYAVTGGNGNDMIVVGPTLNAADTINGGGGSNSMLLWGDYSAGVTLGASTVTNVQTFTFADGSNYNLTLNTNTVASGKSLTLDASALAPINTATLDGSAIGAGRSLSFLGGSGNDVLTGGAGTNVFYGAGGADMLNAGTGVDTFLYRAASDSPFGAPDDTISGFLVANDKINLQSLLLTNKTVLDVASGAFNGNFAGNGVAVDYGQNGAGSATVYVDASKNGTLGAGDMVVQVTGVAPHSLGNGNFSF